MMIGKNNEQQIIEAAHAQTKTIEDLIKVIKAMEGTIAEKNKAIEILNAGISQQKEIMHKQENVINRQAENLLKVKDQLTQTIKEVKGPISIYELMGIGERLESILQYAK